MSAPETPEEFLARNKRREPLTADQERKVAALLSAAGVPAQHEPVEAAS